MAVSMATVTAYGLIKVSPWTQMLDPVAPVPTVNVDDARVPTEIAVTLLNSVVVLTVMPVGPVRVVVRDTPLVSMPVIVNVEVLILPVLVTLTVR